MTNEIVDFTGHFPGKRHLWLDIEDTMATSAWRGFDLSVPINTELIKSAIALWKPDHIHIWSFALWNHSEKVKFERDLRPALQEKLEIDFEYIPCVDEDIIPLVARNLGLNPANLSFQDLVDFSGKSRSLQDALKVWYKGNKVLSEHILLDDCVSNEVIDMWDSMVNLTTANVLHFVAGTRNIMDFG